MNVRAFPTSKMAAIPSRAIKLGFLSPHNAFDRRAFSGTAFFAARALEQVPGIDLRRLGKHQKPGVFTQVLGRSSPQTRLDDCDFDGLDAVVGVVATGLLDRLSQIRPGLPFLHVTDATPAFLRDAYGWAIPAAAAEAEARVAAHAAVCIYSSGAMAERAPRDLGCPEMIARVQPFGINFDNLPETVPEKPSCQQLNLLFIGLDWVRKGGDVAVATLDHLLQSGHEATLTVIGRCPETLREHPAIRHLGFLSKNRSRDAARLGQALRDAHLLLLPSRADCTPMVVGEAMAHGTPVIATDTGGLAGMIGETGRLLAPESSPALWAKTVLEMTSDPMAYEMLSDAVFDRAMGGFSWNSWASGVARLARWAVLGQADRIQRSA